MRRKALIAEMMKRQCLSNQIGTKEDYKKLFKKMQPVAPRYFSRPGEAPSLVHRAKFDDIALNDDLRGKRMIVKGRFQGGSVGYVYAENMELYMAAFKKDMGIMTFEEARILDILKQEGPLTSKQLKEMTGMLNKEIMPILHKLQKAFMVYEDQIDDDWERGWYVFENEWQGITPNRYTKTDAISKMIMDFLYLNVFGTIDGMKSWLRLPKRDIKEAIADLEKNKVITSVALEDSVYWMRSVDLNLKESDDMTMEPSVYVFHRSDFLVKSQEHNLKENFKGLEVLQYILIDGEFKGAITGHWRQGPHDVEDIVLNLNDEESAKRKDEILAAVSIFYEPPFSHIKKYNGKEI
ncbi:hypothetical protein [Vallitalea okinawensis]|uniref:hypothetical protein n=1 Tax=Vallitalea okinawensis TaxID=2078660 RepID=UPI000CFBC3E0|nr:hypothetical protein [Vallitalea okinawensis]